jgi:phosphoribosylaminoimidazole-succinocarboxamide synthase
MTQSAQPLYRGSVKNLWPSATAGCVDFEFTDAYSVFDWGRMPDFIASKGAGLADIAAAFFAHLGTPKTWAELEASEHFLAVCGAVDSGLCDELRAELRSLAKSGLAHHFVKKTGEQKLTVRQVPVFPPAILSFGQRRIFHYLPSSATHSSRLLPFEVVFRWGVPSGSSFASRMTPATLLENGLPLNTAPGAAFEFPVIEFFTKHEPTDRFLTWDQALHLSALPAEFFRKVLLRTFLLACELKLFFKNRGLELWDGKVEWAMLDSELVLADSIGPDELRLVLPGTALQVSKEYLRDFYRKTKWYERLASAKANSPLGAAGSGWKNELRSALGEPPALPAEQLAIAQEIYQTLQFLVQAPERSADAARKLAELRRRMGA